MGNSGEMLTLWLQARRDGLVMQTLQNRLSSGFEIRLIVNRVEAFFPS